MKKFDEIVEMITLELNENNLDIIGLRTLDEDESYEINNTCRNSYDWNFDFDCSSYETEEPVEFDGTCCTGFVINSYLQDNEEKEDLKQQLARLFEINASYGGSKQVLVMSNDCEGGNDDCELIIANAKVIDIFEKGETYAL